MTTENQIPETSYEISNINKTVITQGFYERFQERFYQKSQGLGLPEEPVAKSLQELLDRAERKEKQRKYSNTLDT